MVGGAPNGVLVRVVRVVIRNLGLDTRMQDNSTDIYILVWDGERVK